MPAEGGASVREQRKKEARTWRLVETPNSSEAFGHSRRRYMRKPFVGDGMISSESRVRETRTPGSMSGEGKRGYGGD